MPLADHLCDTYLLLFFIIFLKSYILFCYIIPRNPAYFLTKDRKGVDPVGGGGGKIWKEQNDILYEK